MGLADLHIHTIYSYDGTASVPAVLARAKQIGLDVIAITDHDEIRGALQAFDLAPEFGIEVIPGIEITTAEGDLLGLFVTENIEPGRPLIETLIKVGEAGGICIAPHPTARGMGMKSLSAQTILQAFRHPDACRILIGIETYNATVLDRESNRNAQALLAECPEIAQVGNSDAHILQAIGLGATEFSGCTAADLLDALWVGATDVRRGTQLSSARMLSTWAINYIVSATARVTVAYAF
ncbi:MAG: PHP domain-containing protein [Anaerolineales bacterium]|nr:PHP domain-containing protein [Anaerolineales bacterium]